MSCSKINCVVELHYILWLRTCWHFGQGLQSLQCTLLVKLLLHIKLKFSILTLIIIIIFLQADNSSSRVKNMALSTTDTLLWQSFASVIIPGITINRTCALVQFLQKKSANKMLRSPWVSTTVGLMSIPFIIKPIDYAVEEAMDMSFRKWTGYHPSNMHST